jgi:CubicO group peptidase (beta-lactamase class C family)
MELKLTRVISVVVLGGLALAPRVGAQDIEGGKERIRSHITNLLRAPTPGVPSLVVAVVHRDAIVWEEAFGWADLQGRIAPTPATPYYTASLTKIFTGVGLAMLSSEGRIDMNRSVNTYLGSHTVRPALWNESAITVQRVADHMAGLTTFNLDCESAAPCRPESAIDRFGVIIRPPGDSFDYANLGYGILGEVIARASKQSYGEFLRRRIFEPLGMRDCVVPADGRVRGGAVRYQYGTANAVGPSYSATPAASSAFCSAHSLVLFARALLNQRPASGARRWSTFVPSGGVEAGPGVTYSRGWWIQQDYVGTASMYSYAGSSNGSASIRLIPSEQFAVVILANMGGLYDWLVDAIVDEFVPQIRERRTTWKPPPPATRQRRPIVPDLVGTWVGAIDTYRGRRSLTLSIDASGEVTGTLAGAKAEVRLTAGGASGPRVFGTLSEADLEIDEATPGSYDIRLGLALYGSRLAGSATTAARPGTPAPALSFLAELTRR